MLMHQFTLLCLSILRLQSRVQVNYCHKRKLFSVKTAVFYQLYNGQVQVACVMACTAL